MSNDFGSWGFRGVARRGLELPAAPDAELSPVGRARIRYNPDTNTVQVSLSGGDYEDIGSGSGPGPVPPPPEVEGGYPVIDVTKDLTELGFPANAVPDVAGGGDPIQDAIDYQIANPGEYALVYIPEGVFRLTKPLLVRNGAVPVKVDMLGGSGVGSTDLTRSAVIQLDGGLNVDGNTYVAADEPVMLLQGGFGCSFRGIFFRNAANTAPESIPPGGILQNNAISDWTTAGVKTNRRAPCAAVVIDPFVESDGALGPSDKYTFFESQYGTPVSRSRYLLFEGCVFGGGYVGTATNLNGGQLARNLSFDSCVWSGNTISYSGAASGVEIRNPLMRQAFVHLDSEFLGSSSSSAPPMVVGGLHERARYWMDLKLSQPLHVKGIDLVDIPSLGYLFWSGQVAMFEGCSFKFMRGADFGAVDDGDTTYHALTNGLLTLKNCEFLFTQPLKFIPNGSASVVSLEKCKLSKELGCSAPELIRLKECSLEGSLASDFLSRWQYLEFSETVTFTKEGSASTGNRGTITYSSDLSEVSVGDMAYVWTGSPTSVNAPLPDGTTQALSIAPIGVVDEVNGQTVTLRDVSNAMVSGSSYRIYIAKLKADSGSREISVYQKPDILTNVVQFPAGFTQLTIEFGKTPEGGFRNPFGTSYFVLLSGQIQNVWVTDKTESSFKLNRATDAGNLSVGYQIVPNPTYGNTLQPQILSLNDIPGLALLLDPTGVGIGSPVRWGTAVGLVDSLGNPLKATQQMTIFGPSTAFVPPPEVLDERILFTGNSSGGVFGWDGFDPVAEFGSTSTWFARGDWVDNGTGGYVFYNAGLEDRFAISGTNSWNGPYPASRIVMTGVMGGGEKTVIVSRNGANMFAAVDGVVIGSTTLSASFTNEQLISGGFTNFSGAGQYTEGSFRILGAYGSAINPSQAAQLHEVLMSYS